MSNTTPPNNEDSLREQLVAYLDGELPPAEAREIESRLGSDAAYQRELQSLDRVWDALDELAQPVASESFSKTTIEMVAVEAQREVTTLTAALPVVEKRRRWITIGTAAASLLVGLLFARVLATAPDRALAHDLPIVWRVDALMQSSSGSFHAKLNNAAPGLLDEYGDPETQAAAQAWEAIVQETSGERATRIGELPDADKSALFASNERFRVMPRGTQAALAASLDSLQEKHGENPEVFLAALAYSQFVSQQSPEDQAELRKLNDDDEKLRLVGKLWSKQRERSRRNLDAEDAATLRDAVASIENADALNRVPRELSELQEVILDEMRNNPDRPGLAAIAPKFQEWSQRFQRRVVNGPPALRVAVLSQVAHGDGRLLQPGRTPGGPQQIDELREHAKEDWREVEGVLRDALSDKARETLDREPPERRAMRLRAWVLESAEDAMRPGSMEEYFASDALTDSQRSELLALPRDQRQQRLKAHYYDRELRGLNSSGISDARQFLRGSDRGGRPRGDRDRRGPPTGGP